MAHVWWPSAMYRKRKATVSGLLQRVQQAGDCSVQILVGPPHLLDLIDRVQHRCVMLAAELPADLRQRSGGELFHDIHRHLPWKRDRPRIAAHLQVLLAQIEMLAHALLDEINRDALL